MRTHFTFLLSAFICTLCIAALHLNGMEMCTASLHADTHTAHHSAHAHTDACGDEASHSPSCTSRTCCEHTHTCNNSHTYIAYTKDTRISYSTHEIPNQFTAPISPCNNVLLIQSSTEFISSYYPSLTISFLSTIVLRQ